MNVNLGEYFENYVVNLVESGHYQSQSEVVREGLRLLEQQQKFYDQKLKNLREAIDSGMNSFKKKKATILRNEEEIDDFFDQLMQHKISSN